MLGDIWIVLSKLSMIWNYRLYQFFFFKLSIVFNSVNDREHTTDYYFYSFLLSLFPISQIFFFKKVDVQFIENLQDGRHRLFKCDVLSSNLPALSLLAYR